MTCLVIYVSLTSLKVTFKYILNHTSLWTPHLQQCIIWSSILLCKYKNFFLSLPFKPLVRYLMFGILLCFTDTTLAGWLFKRNNIAKHTPNQTALVDCSAFEGLIFCAVYWTMEKLQSLGFKLFSCPVLGVGSG